MANALTINIPEDFLTEIEREARGYCMTAENYVLRAISRSLDEDAVLAQLGREIDQAEAAGLDHLPILEAGPVSMEERLRRMEQAFGTDARGDIDYGVLDRLADRINETERKHGILSRQYYTNRV